MTSTASPTAPVARRSGRRETGAPPRAGHARSRQRRRPGTPQHRQQGEQQQRTLARYTDAIGRAREVVAQRGHAGSILVVDSELASREDRRLVAHLAADEPAANAALECERYVKDAIGRSCPCRLLSAEDLLAAPFADEEAESLSASSAGASDLLDEQGRRYLLESVHTGMSIPELRWRRHESTPSAGGPRSVSVREVIAQMQAYEPVRPITRRALALHREDPNVSVTVLGAELSRVLLSPIVLNRGLREGTLATIRREELSLSEIAIRCGRIKRDLKGNESGETSWLARRLGMLPEGGRDTPTPWIHSDVLALIARRGLGVSPREVEVQ
jgi:hypothetical protein